MMLKVNFHLQQFTHQKLTFVKINQIMNEVVFMHEVKHCTYKIYEKLLNSVWAAKMLDQTVSEKRSMSVVSKLIGSAENIQKIKLHIEFCILCALIVGVWFFLSVPIIFYHLQQQVQL